MSIKLMIPHTIEETTKEIVLNVNSDNTAYIGH